MEQHKKCTEVQQCPKAQWRQQEALLDLSSLLDGSKAGWWARTGARQITFCKLDQLADHLNIMIMSYPILVLVSLPWSQLTQNIELIV